jgi:HD-GYP domain-containing protein (c-di-GMP phosphodiesterase class II)
MLHEVIHTMVHKTNAHRGIIWVKNGKKKLQPVASAGINIEDVPVQGEITDYHDVLDQIQKRQQFVLRYKDDKDFLKYCPVLTKKEECVLIVPVTNVAILHLVYASREIADEPLANLLTSLSKKLSVAIEACLAHKNIINEVQMRVEADEELKKKTDQLILSEKELQRLYEESEQARKSLLSILEDVTQKEEALRESEQNLRSTLNGTIHTIAATVDARDPYTAGHQKRVADLSAAIASEMHLSDEKVEGIKMAGIIHDLGKIKVPAEILSKPGKLSDLEFQIIQTHPQVGFNLFSANQVS